MNFETQEVVEKIKKKVKAIIQKEFSKAGIDSSYTEFRLSARELSDDFMITEEIMLIDYKKYYCYFCGKEAYGIMRAEGKDIICCANCYGAFKGEKDE